MGLLSGLLAIAVPHESCANDFERAATVIAEHCLRCHNDVDRKGDLSLETGEELSSFGLIDVKEPGESYLLKVVTSQNGDPPSMPEDGEPLTQEEVQVLRDWISSGAAWPEGRRLEEPVGGDFDWWSLQPIRRPGVPAFDASTAEHDWIRTPIDAFILHALHEKGLTPSAAADRRTLIRRVTYDLTGLPPTPEDIREFVDSPDPLAYERLVDRLLASPQYGERWARHWLDVVKYADTCGYDKDKLRPNAWPYRDYVIRSFNNDKPYRRFVQEQIAGDVLFPESEDGILGLGFIAAGPWDFIGHVEVPESKIDGKIARNLDRDEMVSNTLNTFCSVTVQCARCHNHKFDPISQEHYYGMQAVFAAVDRADRPYEFGADGKPRQSVYAAATRFEPQGQFAPTGGQPREIRVLHRGNVQQPGELAVPGALPLSPEDTAVFALADGASEGERRAALARWLTRDDHPLTWRSIVNRIWQYHFGQGIVASPNDFGRMGQLPTHPELLDWLAVEFRASGGSFKHLHRLIVTSSVYRQSSDGNVANMQIDAGNRYLWRMDRRRLEAEEIRDTILVVSGRLDLKMGGPGYHLFELEHPEHSPHYEYHKFDPEDPRSHRRSIYRFIVRSQPDPYMTTLDCADSSQSTPRRDETLTSLQALSMLNNRFNLCMAAHFSARLESESDDLSEQVNRGFTLVTGRPPTPDEREHLADYAGKHGLPNLCRLLFNLSESVYVD